MFGIAIQIESGLYRSSVNTPEVVNLTEALGFDWKSSGHPVEDYFNGKLGGYESLCTEDFLMEHIVADGVTDHTFLWGIQERVAALHANHTRVQFI